MKRIVPAALLIGLLLHNFIDSNVYAQVLLAAAVLLIAAGAACVMTEGTQLLRKEDFDRLLDMVRIQEV